MNDMNNFNSGRAKGFAVIITRAQQGDRKSMEQLAHLFLGVENSHSPIFYCFRNNNLVY
jgi:hypothetical protein